MPETTEQELTDVWRFVAASDTEDLTEDCFLSHSAKGKPLPKNIDACRWSSCSLFQGEEKTSSMLKLPAFKRYAARALLEIPARSGRALVGEKGHVDFWPYKEFYFKSAVKKVVPK